MDEKKINLAST